jgi:hypothetical protein
MNSIERKKKSFSFLLLFLKTSVLFISFNRKIKLFSYESMKIEIIDKTQEVITHFALNYRFIES